MHSYFQGNLISGQAAEPESDGSWRLGWGAPVAACKGGWEAKHWALGRRVPSPHRGRLGGPGFESCISALL